MSAKAYGILVLIIIACLVSPGFAAAAGATLSFVFQCLAIFILTAGLSSLLVRVVFGSSKTSSSYNY